MKSDFREKIFFNKVTFSKYRKCRLKNTKRQCSKLNHISIENYFTELLFCHSKLYFSTHKGYIFRKFQHFSFLNNFWSKYPLHIFLKSWKSFLKFSIISDLFNKKNLNILESGVTFERSNKKLKTKYLNVEVILN